MSARFYPDLLSLSQWRQGMRNESGLLDAILESVNVHGASLRGHWTDNRAQVARWLARLWPGDHGLVREFGVSNDEPSGPTETRRVNKPTKG
jgi:hypothetical protein